MSQSFEFMWIFKKYFQPAVCLRGFLKVYWLDGKGGKVCPELADNAGTAFKKGEGRGLKEVY